MILVKDGVALYAGDLTLTDTELRGRGFVDRRLNTSNSELIDIPTPKNFRGRGFTWDGTTLTPTAVHNQKLIQNGKKALLNKLKAEYVKRSNAATIGGVIIGDILDQLQDAAFIITNSIAANHAVVSGENATLINPAKLNAVYSYKADCSTNAISHRSAIQALNNINDIESYDLSTGWPSEAL